MVKINQGLQNESIVSRRERVKLNKLNVAQHETNINQVIIFRQNARSLLLLLLLLCFALTENQQQQQQLNDQ